MLYDPVSLCLGYIMKTENVKVNPKSLQGNNSTQMTKWTGKTTHVTMKQKGLTSWGKIDDKITLKYLYLFYTNLYVALHKVFY